MKGKKSYGIQTWPPFSHHAVYDVNIYFLGLHPRLVERPLQGR